jgi:hypothetical protein
MKLSTAINEVYEKHFYYTCLTVDRSKTAFGLPAGKAGGSQNGNDLLKL